MKPAEVAYAPPELSGEVSAVKAEPAVPTDTAGERERPDTAVEASEEPVVVRTRDGRGGVVEPEPDPPDTGGTRESPTGL